MSDRQLDLFSATGGPERTRPSHETRPVVAWDVLADESLVAALSDAGIADSLALAAEAGRRRLAAAIPALEALCRRFTGFGVDRIVPEQAAALDALVAVGGPDAARTIARVIAKGMVRGPCLQKAVAAAAGLGAKLSAATVLPLLQHDDPQIRADACRCAGAWPQAVPLLRDLLDDLRSNVQVAAACALGRMGRTEGRALLARCLRAAPCAEVIDSIAPVADEDCVILLGRIARTDPGLSEPALDALERIDHFRAKEVAGAIRSRAV